MALDNLVPTSSKTVQIFNDFNKINFAGIIEIFLVSWALIWLVKHLLPWLANRAPGRLRLYLLPSVPVLRLVILLAAIALIAPMVIKTSLQNIVALLGFAAVAVGFAFKEYISSLLAGVVAVYERPYRVGDWVKVDGAYGEIISMNLRALRMFTFEDTVVTIPHIKIWENNIFNANDGKRNLLCVANFFVDPNHDAGLVRQKLSDVALTSPYLDINHQIRVIVQEQPWGTHYQLKAYPLDGRDQFLFTSDLTVRGKAALAKMGAKPAQALPAAEAQAYTGRT
jgi:small conductance mechanosensitive channel